MAVMRLPDMDCVAKNAVAKASVRNFASAMKLKANIRRKIEARMPGRTENASWSECAHAKAKQQQRAIAQD